MVGAMSRATRVAMATKTELPTTSTRCHLLPQIHRWHQLAGELPKDELVIVLPEADSTQRKTLTTVAELLQKSGHHVHVVQENELTPPRFGEIVQTELGI
jgi:hypothetical protein